MDRLQEFREPDHDFPRIQDDAAIEPPPAIGTDERRMHVRAYNHWVALLKSRSYPSVDDLELDNTADFGPYSVLLDFTNAGEPPVIVWLGEKLREECNLGRDVATIADVPARSLLSRLTDHHLQIIANRAPIGFEAEFVNARGNEALYRGILMPFSSDDETIDFVYGVINWKEVAAPDVTDRVQQEMQAALTHLLPRKMVAAWADGPSGSVRTKVSRAALSPTVDDGGDNGGDTSDDGADALPGGIGPKDSLADWLAAARSTADAALSADTRGRAALYRALGGAYDFALIAENRSDEYASLLAEAGLKVQARAPMTPIAKLIFGANYDKTRLTEFAAALAFSRRRQLPVGGMRLFLENYPGGLKAIVAAERRERRPADKAARPDVGRERARALPEQARLTLAGDDEFVILVARRIDAEHVAVIGIVPDDKPMLDRAIKAIVE